MYIARSAIFSDCRTYRYYLTRQWDSSLPLANFICLNPSNADADRNDPTTEKCIRYGRKWGFGGIILTNIFAYISPSPEVLFSFEGDCIGPENDRYILKAKLEAFVTIAAWGDYGIHDNRHSEVMSFFDELFCLKVSALGQPRHPLSRLKDDVNYVKFS